MGRVRSSICLFRTNRSFQNRKFSNYSFSKEGKVQKEELDFWRVAGGRGPDRAYEGAGRNRQGFSLPRAKRKFH
jgi:hypothetical protein